MSDSPTPLLLIAGQVVHPFLAERLVAGAFNATVDQNGSGYRLFEPPDGATPTLLEAARVVRNT